ncbi:MAG: hypothetical protein IJC80_02770 [Clostridia bacterium]|nr:hypothetical protein [Clostridia bacterium]
MKKAFIVILTLILSTLCLSACSLPNLALDVLFGAGYRDREQHEHTIEWEITDQTHKRVYTCCPEYTDTVSPHVDCDENGVCDECGAMFNFEFVATENDKKYLILPISNKKIEIYEAYEQYINDIDATLLLSAEESLNEQTQQYSEKSDFYLQIHEGSLCLVIEIIVDLESTTDSSGCGIDHEHLYLREEISKQLSESPNAQLLPTGNIVQIDLASLPEGRNYSFSGEDAKVIVDYLSNLSLISDFSENPDEYGGMAWEISLNYDNGEVFEVYHFGNMIIRFGNGDWYKMINEQARQFNVLIKDLAD